MDALKLENQLCFPLYAAAREVVKLYTPLLRPLGLTYTQYIAMMVMWERQTLTVKELGEQLFLDSGTLTPLLKKLEGQGLVNRKRSQKDERNLEVSITDKGRELQHKAAAVPAAMRNCVNLTDTEAMALYQLLYKVLGKTQ